MASLKHLLFLFTVIGLSVSCAPSPDLSKQANADQHPSAQMDIPQNAAETAHIPDETNPPLPEKATGDTHIHVTISCHRGMIPGTNVTAIPINATVSVVDEKYFEDFSAAMGRGEGSNWFIREDTGEDGIIDIHFVENRKYDMSVIVMDKRFPNVMPSNHAWGRMKVQKGSTVHKNFVMTQAWCDKDREIRGIDPTSYNIQVLDFPSDYDDIKIAGFGVQKRFYARANDSGNFKYYANYGAKFNGRKQGLYLQKKSMIITNVQSEKRIKRICGATGNVDMTIKSDGALGVKTYSGTVDNEIIECKQAYSTYYPYTYADDYDGITTPDIEPNIRHVDSKNSLQRTTCPADISAKMGTAPVTYPGACLESTITHVNIFERDPSATKVFPWGKLHQYSVRYDLTKPEEEVGKVPPTLLP